MIHFERLALEQKPEIDALLRHAAHRGCAFSFANLYIWGRQCAARVGDDLLLFSHFDGRTMYPFPVCPGDPRPAIDALMRRGHNYSSIRKALNRLGSAQEEFPEDY